MLLSVTQIIKEAGLIDTQWFTEHGRERGSAIHKACQYLDEGTLDLASLDPAIEGYVRAYDNWRRASHVEGVEYIECPLADPLGRYRGTPDRVLVARPRVVVDIKTGGYQPWVALQLAAYVNMLPDPYSYRRMALHLTVNGDYSVTEFPKAKYANDLNVFLSCLNIANWKRGNYGK